MSYAERHTLAVTLDGSGDGSATSPPLTGYLHTVVVVGGGLGGGSIVVGDSTTFLQVSSEGTYAPRMAANSVDGSSALFAAGGANVRSRFAMRDTVVVALVTGGTAAATGNVHLIVT